MSCRFTDRENPFYRSPVGTRKNTCCVCTENARGEANGLVFPTGRDALIPVNAVVEKLHPLSTVVLPLSHRSVLLSDLTIPLH